MVERKVDSVAHSSQSSPPPQEVNPPFLELRSPADLEAGVELDTNVFFRVTDTFDDANSGVNISTLQVTIQVGAGPINTAIANGIFQPGYSGSITDVFADGLSFDVDIDPAGFFAGGNTVTIVVQVNDTQPIPNQLNAGNGGQYTFDTRPAESTAPVLQNEDPVPSSPANPSDTNIFFRITDAPIDPNSGVDTSTLFVEIKRTLAGGFETVISGGVFQPGFTGTITDVFADGLSFDVDIDPDVNLGQPDTTTVHVVVDDTSDNANTLDTTYTFDVVADDPNPPFVTARVPSAGATGVDNDADITFVVDDIGAGVDLGTIQVDVEVNAGGAENAVINGVIQPGFAGSITPFSNGFQIILDRDTDYGASAAVEVTVDADDLAVPPNSMVQVQYEFFTIFPLPFCRLARTEVHALIGSIIQLDGRESRDPDGLPITWEWKFLTVPSGSVIEQDVGLVNPDSLTALREGFRAVSFIPDVTGTYIVELTVSNGGATSSCTVVVSIGLSLVPCGEGVVPDAQFIWRFLSNFYDLVVDREYFQVLWSAAIQILGAELTKLYSNDANKSLETIQPTVMRRWLQILFKTDLLDNPQTLIIGNTTAGTFGTTGSIQGSDPSTTAILLVSTAGPYSITGKILKLQIDDLPPFGVTFTGTDPLTAAAVVSQINAVAGVTVAVDQSGTLELVSSFIGDDSLIRILGGDAAADFGLALGQEVTGTSSGLTRVIRVPLGDPSDPQKDNFTLLDVNYGVRGRIIDINGAGFTIDRVFNESNAAVAADSVFKFDGATFTDITVQSKEDEVNVSFFDADNDFLYVGHVTPFGKILFKFQTVAGGGMSPTFELSDGVGGWTTFTPSTEDTNGMQQDGNVEFVIATLIGLGWAAQQENGQTRYYIRIQRNNASDDAPVEKSIKVEDSVTIVSVSEETVVKGQKGIPYRVPHLLHTPGIDLEERGVSAGDTLVLEATRKDTNQSAEFRVQVVTVDGERLGFEFDTSSITAGAKGVLDHSIFRQLVQDLRLISPAANDDDIAAVGEALIQMIPTGINLATRPFTTYQITIRAKKVIHNNFLKINDLIVGLPSMQEEVIRNPPFIFLQNTDYILENGYIVWRADLFGADDPAPEELWSECAHIDNNPTVEKNFGRLVDLREDDLVSKATRAPFLAAVKGLWFAITGSPSVANVRLALHILMGLPFSEARGRIIAIDTTFSTDSFGDPIGRILAEDIDEQERPLGFRRFYFFPTSIGLDLNPNTGETFAVGDVLDAFVPLSQGAVVQDHVNTPLWWVRSLAGKEIQKFHTFRAQIDTESGVFDENDLVFSVQFLRTIKPVYSDIIASVLLSLEDDDILDNFTDTLAGSSVVTRFYDNVGAWGGHESTVRSNDMNHQAIELWHADGRPFSTRTTALLRDVVTSQNGADVEADSATGFGSIRPRVLGDLSHPTVEGDVLAILENQAGAAGPATEGLYEVTAATLPNGPLTLGNEVSSQDPLTWDVNAPDSALFPFGTDLQVSMIRRALNPVVQGTNLETFGAGPNADEAESLGSLFVTNGVAIDDHLVIEAGANAGEYRIVSMVLQTIPRDYTPSGVPQVTETRVRLVDMDGAAVVLSALTLQEFRVIRPAFLRTHIEKTRIVQDTGDMYVEVLDFDGASLIPFDTFTPEMVGEALNVAQAENPLNDGDYTILEYIHAGRVRITAGSPQTSDASPTAILTLTSRFHPGFEKAEELAPLEAFEAVVV